MTGPQVQSAAPDAFGRMERVRYVVMSPTVSRSETGSGIFERGFALGVCELPALVLPGGREEGAPVDMSLFCGERPWPHSPAQTTSPRVAAGSQWGEDRLPAAARGRVQPKPVQRAAKSFFFSFSQVSCFGLGHSVILLFPITLQGSHESARGGGPLMSGPSLPPPWGEASLLRIRAVSS